MKSCAEWLFYFLLKNIQIHLENNNFPLVVSFNTPALAHSSPELNYKGGIWEIYHLTLFTTKDNTAQLLTIALNAKIWLTGKRIAFQEVTKNGSKQVTEYDTSCSNFNCS